MEVGTPKTMNDGTTAYISPSKRYYIRSAWWVGGKLIKEKQARRIEYYTLRGKYIPLARAKCLSCGEEIFSLRCGDFVSCSCGKISVDTDRWMPERHRYLGECKQLVSNL